MSEHYKVSTVPVPEANPQGVACPRCVIGILVSAVLKLFSSASGMMLCFDSWKKNNIGITLFIVVNKCYTEPRAFTHICIYIFTS